MSEALSKEVILDALARLNDARIFDELQTP